MFLFDIYKKQPILLYSSSFDSRTRSKYGETGIRRILCLILTITVISAGDVDAEDDAGEVGFKIRSW